MKLKQLIEKYRWEDLWPVLIRLYPDQEKNRDGYRQVFDELDRLQPIYTKMRIFIEQALDELSDNEPYISVTGRDGTLLKEVSPEHVRDDETANEEVPVALEYEDWEEWLGMEIDPVTITNFPEIEILAHTLFEMTFFGFDQGKIRNAREKIMRDIDEPSE